MDSYNLIYWLYLSSFPYLRAFWRQEAGDICALSFRDIMAWKRAIEVFSLTTIPQPSDMASGDPPVLKVMTGVPQANASKLVVGNVSSKVGLTKAKALL